MYNFITNAERGWWRGGEARPPGEAEQVHEGRLQACLRHTRHQCEGGAQLLQGRVLRIQVGVTPQNFPMLLVCL